MRAARARRATAGSPKSAVVSQTAFKQGVRSLRDMHAIQLLETGMRRLGFQQTRHEFDKIARSGAIVELLANELVPCCLACA